MIRAENEGERCESGVAGLAAADGLDVLATREMRTSGEATGAEGRKEGGGRGGSESGLLSNEHHREEGSFCKNWVSEQKRCEWCRHIEDVEMG